MISAQISKSRPRGGELTGMGALANNGAAQPGWTKIAWSVDREHIG
jgi:hypothetical protein